MSTYLKVLRYRARFRWWPRLLRWTVCAARGHRLGQVEMYPVSSKRSRDGKFWEYSRPCKRCCVAVGCAYESMRGIYEYEAGYRHDGRTGIDALIEEASDSLSPAAPQEGE